MAKKYSTELLLIPVLFILIYYPAFSATFFFSDDIHQLWYGKYVQNNTGSATQGRWISGIIFQKLFGQVTTIAGLSYLRLFSLIGWLITTLLGQILFSRWAKLTSLGTRAIFLMNIFIICSIPVAICIGWVSCLQLFVGVAAGLLSGHIVFTDLLESKTRQGLSRHATIFSLLTGLISLFTYQHTFCMFLLPFFIYYINYETAIPRKAVLTGIIYYAFVLGIYFLLFTTYISLTGIALNDRVKMTTDIGGKFSFLFSDPLPAAFSVNLLYSARSLFSQIIAPLLMTAWAVSVFVQFKKRKRYEPWMHIGCILIFLILLYLPSMIVNENFAPYRTLFVFNLAVFYLFIHQLFFFVKKKRSQRMAVYCISGFLVITGFYNFHFQFVNPLKAEYQAFRHFMDKQIPKEIQTIYFVRADRFMFSNIYHTLPYKDEFGIPSTSRDWVPEPLVKQYVFETTRNRALAEKIKVVQYADSTEFNNAHIRQLPGSVVLNMNKIFLDYLNDETRPKTD